MTLTSPLQPLTAAQPKVVRQVPCAPVTRAKRPRSKKMSRCSAHRVGYVWDDSGFAAPELNHPARSR